MYFINFGNIIVYHLFQFLFSKETLNISEICVIIYNDDSSTEGITVVSREWHMLFTVMVILKIIGMQTNLVKMAVSFGAFYLNSFKYVV